MKWKVLLVGNENGLEDLAESFDNDPQVFAEDDEYFLWSSEFEEIDEVEGIKEAAEDIVRAIRNFGTRDSLRVEDLAASRIHEIREDGSENVQVFAEAETVTVRAGPVRATIESENGTEEVYSPAGRTYEWTTLALEDDRVADLVDILEQGDSWVNLYRVYEFIQDNIDADDNIVDQGWWTQQEKNQFKRTANSRDAIGDDARHGNQRIPSPNEPMSHGEAKQLIWTLIDRWLQHRQTI